MIFWHCVGIYQTKKEIKCSFPKFNFRFIVELKQMSMPQVDIATKYRLPYKIYQTTKKTKQKQHTATNTNVLYMFCLTNNCTV